MVELFLPEERETFLGVLLAFFPPLGRLFSFWKTFLGRLSRSEITVEKLFLSCCVTRF